MVKTKTPLFGFGASKSIGKTITYRRHKARTIAQRKFTPRDPKSAKQLSIRYAFRDLLREWKNLTPTQKDSWENWVKAKKKRNWRGYDLFGSDNFQQFHATGTYEKWADYDLQVALTTGEIVTLTTGEIVVINMRN